VLDDDSDELGCGEAIVFVDMALEPKLRVTEGGIALGVSLDP
jgi:hypothetical protein